TLRDHEVMGFGLLGCLNSSYFCTGSAEGGRLICFEPHGAVVNLAYTCWRVNALAVTPRQVLRAHFEGQMMKDAATLRSSAYRLAAQNAQGSSSAVELATQTAFEAVSYDTAGGVVTPNLGAWVDQTINYTYDPLYRLTAADYDNGSYYHYSYDANGNRVTETTVVGTVESVYDAANRLTSVGGVSYTWDDNGNLLADGQRSYTYDSANRLTSVTQGTNASTYTYNGLGERDSETVNGATTTFALDLNAGLTQVLQDGTNTYLYGNGRIGQFYTSESAYFLGDALGSVRQLTDSGGSLTLTRAFEPYGELMNSLGSGSSAYGFTGEWASSSTNLLYLRARYYSGNMGRFLNKDTWQGDYKQPLTLNGWNYVNGNPINYRDPSGYIKEKDADKANSIVRMLEAKSIRII
ncbi:RHS repeat-associated core domain-containing protein, partial [bacterium]